MTEDILSDLNPAQREAVVWGPKPLLVLAGAGSGKTRILTRRMVHFIQQGIPSYHILGVTFTNKAAQEMKVRVEKLVRQDVWISTFHSTCLRILRMDGMHIKLDKNFTIYDDQDQLVLIRECERELGIDDKKVHPKGIRERIQRAKDSLLTPGAYLAQGMDSYEENVAKVYQLYETKMERLKACDFGDLIMKTALLFENCPAVLKSWQDRFRHILIDEYQDTNHAQYRLVKHLASAYRQITVVGDPDQSIYAWRGADINNILNFEKDYPECGMIRMEQNYRSSPVILEAANEMIQRNQLRKHKSLWTEKKGGELIAVFEAENERQEAEYVVQQILDYKEKGRPFAEQVIFYRVHAQSRIFEDVLRRYKIPYKIVGGVRFYDRKEIKDLVAYLKCIANPHDDVSLKRILNVPARGIGKKAFDSLESAAREKQISLDMALKESAKIPGLTPKTRKAIEDFYRFLSDLRSEYSQIRLKDLFREVLDRSRYVAALEIEKTIESQARIENIEEFFTVIEEFEENYVPVENNNTLVQFLESISLVTDLDTWDTGTNVLTLMTFHTAKGLEFPIVYMVGLEEGIFPNVNSFGEDVLELEEERRLCYVGITRAKEKLNLSFARERRIYGTRQFNLPSRFLTEIPSALVESKHFFYVKESRSDLENDIEIDYDEGEIRRRILYDTDF